MTAKVADLLKLRCYEPLEGFAPLSPAIHRLSTTYGFPGGAKMSL